MADYHILRATDDARGALVAFHLPVPDEVNSVAVNLRTAVAEDPESSKTSRVPGISAAELTALANGEIIEFVSAYSLKEGETATEARDALDIKFGTLSTKAADKLRNRYKFWGFSRDVP